jgi:hypothetical protein
MTMTSGSGEGDSGRVRGIDAMGGDPLVSGVWCRPPRLGLRGGHAPPRRRARRAVGCGCLWTLEGGRWEAVGGSERKAKSSGQWKRHTRDARCRHVAHGFTAHGTMMFQTMHTGPSVGQWAMLDARAAQSWHNVHRAQGGWLAVLLAGAGAY